MTWRDRLVASSFKGVPFYWDSSTTTKGRRVPVRKLAGKDGSVQQDLGREPDEIDVTAFLFGPDVDWDRDDLEAVLTEPGPGALSLGPRGDLWVRITRGPVTQESKDEGGYCSIRFSCVVEDRDAGVLSKIKNTQSALRKASNLLRQAATVDFASSFNVLSMPGKYLQQVTNAISNVTSNLQRIAGKISASTNALSDISAALDNLTTAINTLLYLPQSLANELANVVRSVIALGDTASGTIDRTTGLPAVTSALALSETVRNTRRASLAGLGEDVPESGETDLADREAKNTRAVYRLARCEALASACEIYADAFFDSSTLALDVLNNLNAEIDALSQYSPSDSLYGALQDLRSSLVEHLTVTAGQLPQVQQVTRYPEVPALVLAHELYGDATREAELVARNQSPYPLFLSGSIEFIE